MTKHSKYKYVIFKKFNRNGKIYNKWYAQLSNSRIDGCSWSKTCSSERDAAVAVDIKLIEMGRHPVNILTAK